MNILLVDDEVTIVSLLVKHIEWQKIGIDKVFVAYTTREARKLLKEQVVDIIICDIEMPQENGLQLLTWVQDAYPDIVKIILTGFPDFTYAQKAINIGVVKYMLKPISFEELSRVVRYCVEEINKKQSKTQNLIDMEKYFYTKLLAEDILPFSDFIDRELKKCGLYREDLETHGLVYIRVDEALMQEKNNSGLMAALSNIAEELFDNIVEIHLWDNIFWIVKSENEKMSLYEMCELFISKLQGWFQREIYAYFMNHVRLEGLSESARNLWQTAMQYRNSGEYIYDVDSMVAEIIQEETGDVASSIAVIEDVKGYLQDHYMDSIGRKDIEEVVHLNGDYLNRIFKRATGYSLIQYIQYYRILVAKRLMVEGKCTITQIGTKVGFDTPSYFAKVFKKWTNMTPYEYYNNINKTE